MLLLPAERYAELKATGQLPSPRGVATAIMHLLQRDDFPIADLVRLVQSDPAIAGRLLKFANSAAFGHGRPVVSLHRAIIALGTYHVRDLVLGFSLLQDNRDGLCPEFDYNDFWSGSLATAIACQELAAFAQIAAEENFTLGLLSRIGELGLATLFPQAYGRLLTQAVPAPEMLPRESTLFGFDHRQLGASMLTEWGLPELLIKANYHHEAPEAADFADGSRQQVLTLSLNFARALATVCVAAEDERWGLLPGLVTRSARLGISPETLSTLVDRIVQHWREWGATLKVRTRDMPPFADLLAAQPPRPDPQKDGPALWLLAPTQPATAPLEALLREAGYGPITLTGGSVALEAVVRSPPPLLLVDLGIRDPDAATFCTTLRQAPLGGNTYILVLAAGDEEGAAMRVLEAGADDVLLKPITLPNLRLRLNLARRMLQLRRDMLREREGTVRSAGEFADAHRRLVQVALTDPLTQLPNRRHGLDFLGAELAVAQALPVSVLMLDIDHFKHVNDTHGHAAGDTVLRRLAELLRSLCRSEDLVFRYGGEEFALVLPGSSLATALQVAERIRHLAAAEPIVWHQNTLRITVSLGVACSTGRPADGPSLIEAADGALYQAKQGGRNRVVAARS